MSIALCAYAFDGPYEEPDRLNDQPGIFVVLDRRRDAFYVLDIGESAVIKTRVGRHDRRKSWKLRCHGEKPQVAVLYTPGMPRDDRMKIEEQLRGAYEPLCA